MTKDAPRQTEAAWLDLLEGDTRAIAYLSAFEFGRFMIDSHPDDYGEVVELFTEYMNRIESLMRAQP